MFFRRWTLTRASFEATPLEESINTVGKSHLCDCGYATIDKSNFNKHMKRCSQSTLAVAPAPDGPSTSGTHVCDQCGKSFRSRFGMSLHIKNKHLEEFKYECTLKGI